MKRNAVIFICCLISLTGFKSKTSTIGLEEIRLEKNKPSVYLKFVRIGERPPLFTGESGKGVWIQLCNNTKKKIVFPVFGVPKEYGDTGMFYSLESGKEVIKTVTGYKLTHLYSLFTLQPGKSVIFSLPLEHLSHELSVKVSFNFDWEVSNGFVRDDEPKHYVYFHSTQLVEKR